LTSSSDGRFARWPSQTTSRERCVRAQDREASVGRACATLAASPAVSQQTHPRVRPHNPGGASLLAPRRAAIRLSIGISCRCPLPRHRSGDSDGCSQHPHPVPSSRFDSRLDGLLHRPAVRHLAAGTDPEVHRVFAPWAASLPTARQCVLTDAQPSRVFPLCHAAPWCRSTAGRWPPRPSAAGLRCVGLEALSLTEVRCLAVGVPNGSTRDSPGFPFPDAKPAFPTSEDASKGDRRPATCPNGSFKSPTRREEGTRGLRGPESRGDGRSHRPHIAVAHARSRPGVTVQKP